MIQRLMCMSNPAHGFAMMSRDDNGAYVRYADHQAALAEKDIEIARLKAEVERLKGIIDKHSQAITMDVLAEDRRRNEVIGGWKP